MASEHTIVPDPDDELEDEFFDDFDPDDPDYDLEDEDEEPEESQPTRQRPQASDPDQFVADLQAENADLKSRLGDVVRRSGQRLKDYKARTIEKWNGVQEWHNEEVVKAREAAFQEGVKATEQRLLATLDKEEKSDYLEEIRISPPRVSPLELAEKVEFVLDDDDSATVSIAEQFVALGVPEDRLDKSSVDTIVATGTAYLTEETKRTTQRQERDEGGRSRVSTGTRQTPAAPVSGRSKSLQEQIEAKRAEVDKYRKKHDINRGVKAKKELEALESEARTLANRRRR